ncbi:T9SS type A sorting domain-containing protein [Edaphocola flava]|uniref:T9SS type A sorting domain-containing protein n=1 Tax=Edaphocola flava TaxID=2499629 RepID=UPI00100B20DB|nr:T9SS type A sorting domain-containing protein [Edaphocola flava]
MNRISKCLTLLGATLAAAPALFAQTATWNGSQNSNWNNAANWTWSNAANAIPDATTDVIIDSGVVHIPSIGGQDSVHCKNMLLIGELNLEGNGILNIHGTSLNKPAGSEYGYISSVESASGQYALSTKINFTSDQAVTINNIYLEAGKINIDCDNLNLAQSNLNIYTEILFSKSPVPFGSPAKGNLIIDTNSLLIVCPQVTYSMLNWSNGPFTQPHIITSRNIKAGIDPYGTILIYDVVNDNGLQGTVQIPLSPSAKSFNSIALQYFQGDYPWIISCSRGLPETCTNNTFDNNEAVQNVYDVFALADTLATTLTTPAQIMLAFNRRPIAEDVLSGFNPNQSGIKMYSVNNQGCYDQLSASSSDTILFPEYTQVFSGQITKVGKFILAPADPSSLRNLSAIEGLNTYPNPVQQSLSLSLSASHDPLKAKLLNVLGQTVWSADFKANALQQGYTINTESLPAGTYILQLQSDTQYTSRKVIKK